MEGAPQPPLGAGAEAAPLLRRAAPRSAHKGVYFVAATHRWRAALRMGPVMKHLGYFAAEADAAAAVAAAAAARLPLPPPPERPSVPGVAWHEGRWLVRDVAGSFATLAVAEEAARRKPRVRAMRGSVPRRVMRPGPSGDKARSFLAGYRQWCASATLQVLSEHPWQGMAEGPARSAAVRAELKARWRAERSGGGGGGGAAAEGEDGEAAGAAAAADAAGAPAQTYQAWARLERARLLASAELAGLDRVERSARVRQQLKALWAAKKGEVSAGAVFL